MSTMDINEYVQQQTDMTSYDRQELMYYIENAINNFMSASAKTPDSPSILGQFGSTNSNDVDLFFVLREEKDEVFTRKIEQFFQNTVAEVVGNGDKDNVRELDITFITTKYGQVDWSSKGNIEQINNAIHHTFSHHVTNFNVAEKGYRENPVSNEVRMDIGWKAVSTIRQILSIISRTENGRDAKRLLLNKSFTTRLTMLKEMLGDGIFGSITDSLHKNQSDESLLKDVCFTFIQLDALLHDKLMPYTKNAVFNTEHTTLLPFIFEMGNFTNDYAECIQYIDELIEDTIDTLLERIESDEDGVLSITGDFNQYDIRKEHVVL